LAVSYINEITDIVNHKFTYEDGIDTEAIENDPTIFELRKKLKRFLESSKLYNLNTIFMKLPHQYMLHEIAFILACDRKYAEAFGLCITGLNDVSYSRYICDQVFLKNGDEDIFFKLFEVLVDNKLPD